MEVLNLKESAKQKKAGKGSVLIVQGGKDKALTIIHSGLAELIINADKITGQKPEKIVNSSIRVGLIKGESICTAISIKRTYI